MYIYIYLSLSLSLFCRHWDALRGPVRSRSSTPLRGVLTKATHASKNYTARSLRHAKAPSNARNHFELQRQEEQPCTSRCRKSQQLTARHHCTPSQRRQRTPCRGSASPRRSQQHQAIQSKAHEQKDKELPGTTRSARHTKTKSTR